MVGGALSHAEGVPRSEVEGEGVETAEGKAKEGSGDGVAPPVLVPVPETEGAEEEEVLADGVEEGCAVPVPVFVRDCVDVAELVPPPPPEGVAASVPEGMGGVDEDPDSLTVRVAVVV